MDHDNANDNPATRLLRLLESEGHGTWGFVIYRCVYSPESNHTWTRLLAALESYTRESLQRYSQDGTVALSKFTLTTIEDSTLLDGATANVVRDHFKSWSRDAIAREQPNKVGGGVRDPEQENGDAEENLPTHSPRYRFCIRAGEEVLDSFQEGEDEEDRIVDLIQRDWVPDEPHIDRRTGRVYDDKVEPAIEGCDRRDVGWMRVSARSVMVDMYDELRGYNDWSLWYKRPYEVVFC
ncbi:hypothetical protein QBC41DRAFT_312222 [Cercophora samala]|uniref:Uncharacterized protein n=1 Tax=Cercophora samala TaxID=330535 RepID=A0AA39ZLD7_9PEZI|nr:hypothetical protein QBC41DRAFT_312222 [Cercophora samala]